MGLFGEKKVFGTVPVPGKAEFELPPGKCKVHYEITGEPDESTTSGHNDNFSWNAPELEITITSSGGPEIEERWAGRGHTIHENGRSDKQIGVVKVPKPGGPYLVEVKGDSPDTEPAVTFSAKV